MRRLIAGRPVSYSCLSCMRYHQDAPAELGFPRTSLPHVAIRSFGLRTPFDGCEIQGTYGHTWPDRDHSHSAVEIAFTARGRRYFIDRAAARDLALFVRSRSLHRLRRLAGDAARTALTKQYGATISELPSTRAPLAAEPDRLRRPQRRPHVRGAKYDRTALHHRRQGWPDRPREREAARVRLLREAAASVRTSLPRPLV